jgi:anti-sigma factor RsiW
MKCPIDSKENAELLLDYCARRLDPERTLLLEAHMAGCEACRRIGEGQRALWTALDQWEAMEVSGSFDRRLYRRIEEEAAPGSRWWRLGQRARFVLASPALPLTATAGLVLAVGFLLHEPAKPPVSPEPPVAAGDVEQVERTLEDLDMLRQLNLTSRGVEDGSGPTM